MALPAETFEFDWDAANIRHLARHRISRDEVEHVFRSDPVIADYRAVRGEERWSAVGTTASLNVLVVVFTVRGTRIRPVTGWKADRRTEKIYFERKG
jgi:uncharacterized DUF497 family protein